MNFPTFLQPSVGRASPPACRQRRQRSIRRHISGAYATPAGAGRRAGTPAPLKIPFTRLPWQALRMRLTNLPNPAKPKPVWSQGRSEIVKEAAVIEKLKAAGLRIKLFMDGADAGAMGEAYRSRSVSGFTTNPTLMRKAGITDYERFAREVIEVI